MIPYDLLADVALMRIKNPTAKIVLLAIARYADRSGMCYPSQPRLADDTCLSERTIRSCVHWLQENGYITISSSPNKPNIYTITSMTEESMTDDEVDPAKSAAEEVSNISRLDFSKKREANYTTLTSSAAKSAGSHPSDTPHFLAFWAAYPKRQGKGEARTAFAKQLKFTDATTLINAANDFARWCEVKQTDKQYIPLAATWLNQSRWEDELDFEQSKPQSSWGSVFNDL